MFLKILLISVFYCAVNAITNDCFLPKDLVDEILSYELVVRDIFDAVKGQYVGVVYNDTTDFVDTFGSRLSGTQNLEDSIEDVIKRLEAADFEVHKHRVKVPVWLRGEESLEMLEPRKANLTILGLGLSAFSPSEGVTAELLVVRDFHELDQVTDQVPGKIVLFNSEFTTYNETSKFRMHGPAEASKRGAVAALVRSIAPFSIGSPHTGATESEYNVKLIPAAAITLEDADLLQRLSDKGKTIKLKLKMSGTEDNPRGSFNVIGDLVGRNPEEFVVVSGHIDSWDVGQGAMDDAAGCFVSWHALALIRALNLPLPRRTLRVILWTGEEQGLIGAKAYLKDHPDELKQWSAAFESDAGIFQALGWRFAGNADARCIMKTIGSLLSPATQMEFADSAGSDISVFGAVGVPLGEPLLDPKNPYFWFHHTNGDSMRVMTSEDMDQNLALIAATAYVLADLSILLPRGEQTAADLIMNEYYKYTKS